MNCQHQSLDAAVKVSLKDGRHYLCFRVWCQECLIDFEITDNAEKSIDGQQALIEIKPSAMVMNVSSMEQ